MTHPAVDHLVLLTFSGFAAGAMNSLAGGGSFVSLPALIAAGVPSVQANASSTVALYPGGLAGTWAYRDGLEPVSGVSLTRMGIVTAAGGLTGALLLLWTPSKTFDMVVPWLLLIATLLLAFGRQAGERLRGRFAARPSAILTLQFALGIYGGYFGGAVGIMMLALWSILGGAELKRLQPARTLMVSAANASAVLLFILAGAVAWANTLVMLMAGIVGGYVGGRVGRRLDPHWVRAGTLICTVSITAVFFYRAFVR